MKKKHLIPTGDYHGPRSVKSMNMFGLAQCEEDQLLLIDKISQDPHPECPGVIGDMYLELALNHSSITDNEAEQTTFTADDLSASEEYFQEALSHWQYAISKNGHPELMSAENLTYALRSARQLAYQEDYQYCLLSGGLPTQDIQREVHQKLLEVSSFGIEQLEKHEVKSHSDKKGIGYLRGEMAEIETILLLQRFAIRYGESAWWPYFSKASNQYISNKRNKKVTSSHDIVIKTLDQDGITSDTYKLQVKMNYKNPLTDTRYTDDISVIDFSNLRDGLGRVTRDIEIENSRSDNREYRRATKRLGVKTEKIFKLLDKKDSLSSAEIV